MCTIPVDVAVVVPPVLALVEPVAELKGLFVDGKLPVVDGNALVDASPGRIPNGLLAVDGGLGGTGTHSPLAVCWSMVPLGPSL